MGGLAFFSNSNSNINSSSSSSSGSSTVVFSNPANFIY